MWDKKIIELFSNMGVPSHMIKRSFTGFSAHWNSISDLLHHRVIPEKGWNESQIRDLIHLFNMLDSDKDPGAIRIGEREGRVSHSLLRELSGDFCHGIGRSGNLAAAQPKAAGASLMQQMTNRIVLSLIRELGLVNIKAALTVPMGTGMSIGLALKGCYDHYQIDIHQKPYILMTQIDHKSPKKGVEYVGGKILIVPGHFGKNHWAEEGVFVSMKELENIYLEKADKIGAIVSSSAFFAPRVPDDLKKIARFAKEHNLIHIVNNAYGLQSARLVNHLRSAVDAGRIDAIVQSTDKCFLTPVGGAVIAASDPDLIGSISNSYAGRASAAPVLHLLVSLLSLGKKGYLELMETQRYARNLLESEMKALAEEFGEKLIKCENPVSCALTLSNLSSEDVGKLGGFLYNLRVTGPRVINMSVNPFGSCTTQTELNHPYIVMNAAIGVEESHIISAIDRLQKAFTQLKQ